jgi:hypothetical protein
MRLALRAGAGAGLMLLALLVAPAAGADPPDEALVAAQVAAARAAAHVTPLTRAGDLDAIARRQAARMAAGGGLPFHNPRLGAETGGWTMVGEVVGRVGVGPGWDVRLHQSFLASPTHRRVILNGGYTHIGVGTARTSGGMIYAAEVFGRSPNGRPVAPPRASRRAATPAPRRLAPTAAPTPPLPPPTTIATPPAPTPRMATSTTLPGGVFVVLPPLRPVGQDTTVAPDLEVAATIALIAAGGALLRAASRAVT